MNKLINRVSRVPYPPKWSTTRNIHGNVLFDKSLPDAAMSVVVHPMWLTKTRLEYTTMRERVQRAACVTNCQCTKWLLLKLNR